MLMAFIFTIFCLFIGFALVTARFGAQLQERLKVLNMDLTLRKVLAMLKGHGSGQAHDEIAAEKVPTTDAFDESDEDHVETHQEKLERYQNSSIEECSDDEFWRLVHHGAPTADDPASSHHQNTDVHLENIMRETNRILDGRTQRLRQEYEAAGARSDQLSMDAIESDMDDCTHVRYSI